MTKLKEKITWGNGKSKKIEFEGYNPFIRQLRTDKGWRVEIDISQSEYDIIKDLPKIQDKRLKISIEETKEEPNKNRNKKEEFESL